MKVSKVYTIGSETFRDIVNDEGKVILTTDAEIGCEECQTNPWVSHHNCLYDGRYMIGHSESHCTADSCY